MQILRKPSKRFETLWKSPMQLYNIKPQIVQAKTNDFISCEKYPLQQWRDCDKRCVVFYQFVIFPYLLNPCGKIINCWKNKKSASFFHFFLSQEQNEQCCIRISLYTYVQGYIIIMFVLSFVQWCYEMIYMYFFYYFLCTFLHIFVILD